MTIRLGRRIRHRHGELGAAAADEDPPRRKRSRRAAAAGLAMAAGLIATSSDVAGASAVTYWSGWRAPGSWYVVPGYWSYWGNEVGGAAGIVYYGAMYRSNGVQVSFSSSWDYTFAANYTGYYVSPRCAHTASTSVNFWCVADY